MLEESSPCLFGVAGRVHALSVCVCSKRDLDHLPSTKPQHVLTAAPPSSMTSPGNRNAPHPPSRQWEPQNNSGNGVDEPSMGTDRASRGGRGYFVGGYGGLRHPWVLGQWVPSLAACLHLIAAPRQVRAEILHVSARDSRMMQIRMKNRCTQIMCSQPICVLTMFFLSPCMYTYISRFVFAPH